MKFDFLKRLDPSAIEDGAWLDLLDPIDGEPLYRDPENKTRPCRALVRSDQSKAFMDSERTYNQITSARLQRAKPKDRDALVQRLAEEAMSRRLGVILVSLENCTEASGVQNVSEEDALAIYEDMSMRWLVNQVFRFSGMQANYGLDPTKAVADGGGAKPPKAVSKS